MSCERLRSLWETFLDGELPSPQVLELQAHLDGCVDCSESVALSDAIRRTARQVVYDDAPVAGEFRARLEAALLSEAREEHDELERARRRRLFAVGRSDEARRDDGTARTGKCNREKATSIHG